MFCRVWFLVRCTTASPITHSVDVVLRAAINSCVIGSGGERVFHLAVINELLHGSAVGLVCAPAVLVKVEVYDHDVKGAGRRFWFLPVGGQFYLGGAQGRDQGCSNGGNGSSSSCGDGGGCDWGVDGCSCAVEG